MAEMTSEKLAEFLAAPRIAVLGTINADGTPALNPVWYSYEDSRFFVVIPTTSYYGKNVARDPRITICVQDEQQPYRAVVAKGTAVIEAEGTAIGPRLRALAIRYFGEKKGNAYADGNDASHDILVSLQPDKIGSWDYGS